MSDPGHLPPTDLLPEAPDEDAHGSERVPAGIAILGALAVAFSLAMWWFMSIQTGRAAASGGPTTATPEKLLLLKCALIAFALLGLLLVGYRILARRSALGRGMVLISCSAGVLVAAAIGGVQLAKGKGLPLPYLAYLIIFAVGLILQLRRGR